MCACSGVSHTLGVIIYEHGEIVGWCLLVVENQRQSDRNSTAATTVILT